MLDKFRETAITWDKATRRIYSPITANASDSNGRKLNIQVVNSGQVENLTGATLHLYWETKDKAHDGLDAFDASDISKGEFEIFYTTGMLSNVGELNATLVLVDSTGKVVSDWFKITVTRGINESAIESENSFTTLTQALIDISNLEQNYTPRLNDLAAQLQQTEDNLQASIAQKASIASVAEKIGGEVKAELENLSPTVLGAINGSGGPFNVLSIPQPNSVDASKTTAEYTFKGELNASHNLNDPLDTGMYFISGDSVPLNAPLQGVSAILYHNSFLGGYGDQIYAGFNKSFAGQDFRLSRTSYYSVPQANSVWRDERSVLPENLTKQFMYHGILTSSHDLNNVSGLKTGIYLMQAPNMPANSPLSDTSLYFHYRFENSFTLQIIVGYNNVNERYFRQMEDGTNREWSEQVVGKKLVGKKVLFMGDSKLDPNGAAYDYSVKFAEITGCNRTNVGYAGAKVAMVPDHEPYNSHSLYYLSTVTDFSQYDAVTIDYMTNDLMWGLTLGDRTTGEYTVAGALYKALENIFNSNPNIAVFLFMPPTPFSSDGTNFYDFKNNPTPNGDMYTYEELFSAVKKVTDEFSVPVLDTWNLSGVNKWNHEEKYEDGIHPVASFKRDELAPMYANFVMSYF